MLYHHCKGDQLTIAELDRVAFTARSVGPPVSYVKVSHRDFDALASRLGPDRSAVGKRRGEAIIIDREEPRLRLNAYAFPRMVDGTGALFDATGDRVGLMAWTGYGRQWLTRVEEEAKKKGKGPAGSNPATAAAVEEVA